MYFLVEVAAMDAFIAAWDTKMYYDFARPYALVHEYYRDKQIKAWGGPERWDDPGKRKRLEALFSGYIFMPAISKLRFRS